LENPQDALSLVGTLRSPFHSLSDEALLLLSRHADGIWAGIHNDAIIQTLPEQQKVSAQRARRFLDRWRGLKDRLPIAGLLGTVFHDSGYDAAMQFESFGDRKLANLWKLMDLARTFDRSGKFGLADFIRRLHEMVQDAPREEQAATQPENADVIKLMSVHQAKGLEFPVVVLPDFGADVGRSPTFPVHWDRDLGCVARPPSDEEPPPFSEFAWKLWRAREDLEDWEEELRTLYVACTRSKDYLILSACRAVDDDAGGPWMTTLQERFDLETGACKVSGVPADRFPKVRVSRTSDDETATKTKSRSPKRAKPCVKFDARHVGPIPVAVGSDDVSADFGAEDGSDEIEWRRVVSP
jgi:ATP-dependent helicase/nuclease subunit A